MVGEQDGLGPLQVGVAGQDDAQVQVGQAHPGPAQVGEVGNEALHLLGQVKAHVQGHLVVPAPGGVELAPTSPTLSVSRDSMAMWMSSRAGSNSNSPASISRRISASPATICVRLRRGDDALLGQHPGVGDGAGDILAVEAPVKA